MPRLPGVTRAALLPVTIAMLAACQDGTGPAIGPTHDQHDVSAAATRAIGTGHIESSLARSVRQATSRFNSTTQAAKHGYAVASPCVASPAGGMGFHWLAADLVDPSFDPFHPEAVLYEPQPDGELQLVAVEYIVVDVGQPAPTFDGQPFDIGGTPLPIPHWSLHVWVHRGNPNGLFAPFNPDVSCP